MTAANVRSAPTSSMATSNQSAPGSEPLKNARHEAFALAWAKGGTATDAARVAGYSVARARFTGRDLATNRHVVARKEWLQRQTATASTLTAVEKREILATIARNAQERASDRIAAIRGDNDLSGDGAEASADAAVADSLAAALRKRARR